MFLCGCVFVCDSMFVVLWVCLYLLVVCCFVGLYVCGPYDQTVPCIPYIPIPYIPYIHLGYVHMLI